MNEKTTSPSFNPTYCLEHGLEASEMDFLEGQVSALEILFEVTALTAVLANISHGNSFICI